MYQVLKIIQITVLICLLLTCCSFASPGYDVKALSKLPEEKIDIGIAGLVLAKEIFPEIDIQEYSKRIDRIAFDVRRLTAGNNSPDYRIRALNTHLYKIFGMEYDLNDPYVKNIKNRYINGILDTKKGSCVSMPLLYLAVAQRLGYPIYAVNVPQHIFLRYVDPSLKMKNIEATGGGGYSSDEEYIESLQISFIALTKGAYLRTLTHREFLGILIAQNGIYWANNGDIDRAIEYLEIAVRLNPKDADSTRSLGYSYRAKGKQSQGQVIENYFSKAKECVSIAEQLGVTTLPLNNYIESQRKAQKKFRNQNSSGG